MTKRFRLSVAVAAAVLVVAVGAAFYLIRNANELLKARIEQGLGPGVSVGSVEAGWSGVELKDIAYSRGAGLSLTAKRATVRADIPASLGGTLVVDTVEIEDPSIKLVVERAGGSVSPRPSLSGQVIAGVPSFSIGRLSVKGGDVVITDERLPAPKNSLHLKNVSFEGTHLALPFPEREMTVTLAFEGEGALLAGAVHLNGTASLGRALEMKLNGGGDRLALLDIDGRGPLFKAARISFSASVKEREDALAVRLDDVFAQAPSFRISLDEHGDPALPAPWGELLKGLREGAQAPAERKKR